MCDRMPCRNREGVNGFLLREPGSEAISQMNWNEKKYFLYQVSSKACCVDAIDGCETHNKTS